MVSLAAAASLAMVFLLSPVSSGTATSAEALAPANVDLLNHPRYKTRNKRKWGIEVAGIRRVAMGYMLVFRYHVIDDEKAKPVFLRKHKPRLIHERTGAEFIVPSPQKTGPLRNSNLPHEGRIYWMAFGNPWGFVQQGDRVTVVIGDFRADLVVQ